MDFEAVHALGLQPAPGPSTKSPRKLLREAIISTISPEMSHANQTAVQDSDKKRKKVQAKVGEVLTTEEVCKRLKREGKERKLRRKNYQNLLQAQ